MDVTLTDLCWFLIFTFAYCFLMRINSQKDTHLPTASDFKRRANTKILTVVNCVPHAGRRRNGVNDVDK